MEMTVREFGVKSAIYNLHALAKIMRGQSPEKQNHVASILGDSCSMQAKIDIMNKWGAGRMSQSIGYEANGSQASVFTDRSIAPHGAMREVGGTIRPFRAKALFVPLKPDIRPNMKGLVFGVDFVFSKLVKQKGSMLISKAISKRLRGVGNPPTLTQMLGEVYERVLSRNANEAPK